MACVCLGCQDGIRAISPIDAPPPSDNTAGMQIVQIIMLFVVFIGPLIFFHELGHFIVAKLCDVKVLRFSMGFGPKLFGFVRGETEYWVSALPLGGYVKMLGDAPGVEIPPEDAPRAFSNRPLWQRSVIAAAGPAFNFLLAIVVYFAVALGTQTLLDTRVGVVNRGDPAWAAGLRPGDRITAIDGEPATEWSHVLERVSTKPGQPLSITYERQGAVHTMELVARSDSDKNMFDETEARGRVGIAPYYVKPVVAIVDAESPAAQAGVHTDDRIERVGNIEVAAWHEVRDAVRRIPQGEPVHLTLSRAKAQAGDAALESRERLEVTFTPAAPITGLDPEVFSAADTTGGYTGLVSKEVVAVKVEADTAAAAAGIAQGDRMLKVAFDEAGKRVERDVGTWLVDLETSENSHLPLTFDLTFQRGREVLSAAVTLKATQEKDELKNEHTRRIFGATNDTSTVDSYTFERKVGPVAAVRQALADTGFATTLIGKGLLKLATGDIPIKSMGGPIMLAVIAEKSAKRGLDPFLRMMALISVNLALLNLLPVPVLDGGHLLMFGIEGVRRRPPSLRFREIANTVGLVLLILLMIVVFHNDIMRFVKPLFG